MSSDTDGFISSLLFFLFYSSLAQLSFVDEEREINPEEKSVGTETESQRAAEGGTDFINP